MHVSDLLTPDGVMEKLLAGVFGPTAAIVAIFSLANLVLAWFGVAKSGVQLVRTSTRHASMAYDTMMRMRPVAVLAATVTTVLLASLQLLWLWSASRIANGLSYLWNAPYGSGRPQLSGLVSYVNWDWISRLYFLASIAALIVSYAEAFGSAKRDNLGRVSWVLAAPLWLPWGLFCLIGSLLALLLAGLRTLSDESPKIDEFGLTALAVMAIVVSYMLAVHLALGSSRTIARLWRPSVP